MYQCPGCGGNLRFDISTQDLSCMYCNEHFDPYSVTKEYDAVENDRFEVTKFSCTQCGGEIFTTDNEAAAFCSYCGASSILTERIINENCPNYIIPFKKTKEDCKKAYRRKMRKAFFTPRELRDSKNIDGFRGIYMPFWVYDMVQDGPMSLKAKRSHRRGDYIITDHYKVTGDMNSSLQVNTYDASKNFYDEISGALAPYDMKDKKEFTPSMLSGFYAESANVSEHLYEEDSRKFMKKVNGKKIRNQRPLRKYEMDSNLSGAGNSLPTPYAKKVDRAMFPVWFLSYKKNDRIAYAAINGQTGKVVADMPVDIKRYIFGSLLLMLPIFGLLNIFMTMKPGLVLSISILLLLMTLIIYNTELGMIYDKEHNVNDKGINSGRKDNGAKKVKITYSMGKTATILILSVFGLIFGGVFLMASPLMFVGIMLAIICIVIGLIKGKYKKLQLKKSGAVLYISAIVTAVTGFIMFVNPVADMWYYGGTIGVILTAIIIFIDIIRYYNRIAMRRLPQFDKMGGDDGAY
ncbi:MAG: hypothetical protein IJA34_04780 [Lachnospiraceae bacterium]|nr:hypothetical protein [Lachnospiraceae bacterium]